MSFVRRTLLIVCFVCSPLSSLSYAQETEKAAAESAPANSETSKVKDDQKKQDFAEAPSFSAVEEKPVYWLCKNQREVRTLRVEAKNQACSTKYSKEGAERVVSQSQQIGVCYHVFANIRRNLEYGNFKCKDISNSRVSASY